MFARSNIYLPVLAFVGQPARSKASWARFSSMISLPPTSQGDGFNIGSRYLPSAPTIVPAICLCSRRFVTLDPYGICLTACISFLQTCQLKCILLGSTSWGLSRIGAMNFSPMLCEPDGGLWPRSAWRQIPIEWTYSLGASLYFGFGSPYGMIMIASDRKPPLESSTFSRN